MFRKGIKPRDSWFLTPPQAAKVLGIHPETAYRWTSARTSTPIPIYWFAQHLPRFAKQDVASLILGSHPIDQRNCPILLQTKHTAYDLITIPQIAVILNISRSSGYRLCRSTTDSVDFIPSLKAQPLSSRYRFYVKKDDLITYIKDHKYPCQSIPK